MAKTKRNIPVEVGQSVWVVLVSSWFSSSEANIEEFKVSKVNGSSFFARSLTSEYDWRFDRSTWKHETGFGDAWQAYVEPDEWVNIQAKAKKERLLRATVQARAKYLSYEQLQLVDNYIKELEAAKK